MVVDEDALLEQFAAQFAHGPGDLDDTAGLPGDSEDTTDESPATFNTDAFLKGLDDIFNRHAAETEAGPYLEQAAIDAENAGDEAGLLTVLNETMGFNRSQGKHKENQWIVQRAIELALRMGLEGSEVWATTLINCATAMRAAKQYDQAEDLYAQALACAQKVYPANDRRLAALHNNLSMLYSETNRLLLAEQELQQALTIVETSSVNPQADIDVASSHTNLALVLLQEGKLQDAHEHAAKALAIYATGKLTHSAHYASALAGFAQVLYAEQRYSEAAAHYRKALTVIAEYYGTDTDYYRITAENLHEAETKAVTADDRSTPAAVSESRQQADSTPRSTINSESKQSSLCPVSGLKLAREFWNQVGKPMVVQRYSQYAGRIAVGLVGHGSECYGFDDRYSQDHDFGPRFCLWLNDEDYAAIGEQLQADYEALTRDFTVDEQGTVHFTGDVQSTAANTSEDADNSQRFSPTTPRAQGASRRDGVFRIGDFFASITGYTKAPAQDAPHEWLMLDEATLAAATNGAVFQDPTGEFSAVRQGFKDMPEDVRLSLISKRLGMIAQAGQYNLSRSLKRGDGAAAWLSINEFVQATASLVFLINKPLIVGYLPYYKWQFAALRKLSGSMFALLPDICEQLETVMRLSSAACYGGASFGEGGKGSEPAVEVIANTVEHIAAEIVKELQREGLTSSSETFLEWQRPYVEEHIQSDNSVLKSL
ncbi:putative tetratricopeptide repeat-containing domain protein [Bifidobacterium saguini DSM 23967]|uniref:DUF4037 domain-containing protein n=2 Tax=Bifidobacterium saguini TaxID=762210 RepID=A0ABX7SGH0_9BIFI|nr:DUF4037 domain-containing protein [Bifidobacterium saguini]KFI93833.1 putative tetratricopeptide repeat-containing domain protein [Bifidobacterium saguini DSM 23967]QTB91573.1 DUF4037 domain-containing protein [Bifidobacterium saguini]